jgi:hypothetical protein
VEGSIGLKPPAFVALDEFDDIVKKDVLVGASGVHVTKTVLTTPRLLVVREGELVWGAVEALVMVELGAAARVVLDRDGVGEAPEQYRVKLGKHDESPNASPTFMMLWIGESAAVKARVLEVSGHRHPIPCVIVGPPSPQANQSVVVPLQTTRPVQGWSTFISIKHRREDSNRSPPESHRFKSTYFQD